MCTSVDWGKRKHLTGMAQSKCVNCTESGYYFDLIEYLI